MRRLEVESRSNVAARAAPAAEGESAESPTSAQEAAGAMASARAVVKTAAPMAVSCASDVDVVDVGARRPKIESRADADGWAWRWVSDILPEECCKSSMRTQ